MSCTPRLRKSAEVIATGPMPTLYETLGKMLPVVAPTDVAGVDAPRLPESRERVTGYRSPTKKEAGLPSCARSKTWVPLCTSVSASENCAAKVGIVRRKVD